MQRDLEIVIGDDGDVIAIRNREFDAIFAAIGTVTIQRASHVEPCNVLLRGLFHVIRRCVDDDSNAAHWTRQWPCRWRVRMLDDGYTFGEFTDRQAAIDAEVAYIRRERFKIV